MDKISTTVGEMRNLYTALVSLAQRELPFKLSYAIARTRRALEGEFESSEDMRKRLLDDESLSDEERQNKWEEFIETEIEFNVHKVDLENFPDSIEPMFLDALFPMIKE